MQNNSNLGAHLIMDYINHSLSFTLGFNDSDHVTSFPFVFSNQSIEPLLKINNSVNNSLQLSENEVRLFKNLMVTRFMPSFYIFIIVISLPLNALALVTFTFRIGPKSPSIIFMSHLACVDLLYTLLLPLKIHYRLNSSDWVFGEVTCRVVTAAFYCYMYSSILLVMCMSVDRLLAVAFPVASLTWRSPRKASCVCVIVWLLVFICSMPSLMIKQTYDVKNVGVTCYDVWTFKDFPWLFYLLMFSTLPSIYFFLPLVVTLVSYFTIIYVLCVKHSHIAKSSSCSNKQRRAAIMTTAMLIEFVVCFAPSNAILLYDCIMYSMENSETYNDSETYPAYLLAVCLGCSSVFLDPLLYYYGSSQYRQKIWSLCGKTRRESTYGNITN